MLPLEELGEVQAPHLHYELRYWGKLVKSAMLIMDIFKNKGQLDSSFLTGCDTDTADDGSKIVF